MSRRERGIATGRDYGPLGTAPQVVDAGLHLLDRQLVDKDGQLAGKVDDLELSEPGGNEAPYVTAILCGPAALGPRIGGRLGRWMVSVQMRLRPETQQGPARISFGVVKRIVEHVDLAVSAEGLAVTQLDRWVSDHLIAKIPGAGHEAE
jgi:hypothetical protein